MPTFIKPTGLAARRRQPPTSLPALPPPRRRSALRWGGRSALLLAIALAGAGGCGGGLARPLHWPRCCSGQRSGCPPGKPAKPRCDRVAAQRQARWLAALEQPEPGGRRDGCPGRAGSCHCCCSAGWAARHPAARIQNHPLEHDQPPPPSRCRAGTAAGGGTGLPGRPIAVGRQPGLTSPGAGGHLPLTGRTTRLTISNLALAQGLYTASAVLQTRAPMALQLRWTVPVTTPLPGRTGHSPLLPQVRR